jgi:rod shape-determining protein MreC
METSRDDFVIAIRSAFLKKGTKQRFSLLGLIFFSIILIVLGNFNFKFIEYLKIGTKEIIYRTSYIISGPENLFKDMHFTTKRHFNFYNDYQENKLELESLRSENHLNKFVIEENLRLMSVIDDYLIVSDEIVAKVLIDKQSAFLNSVVVNKGSKDNIKLGMVVLEKNYLVGKVIEVNFLSSRVLLLSDLNSKIPVSIEPKGIQSILSGTGKVNGVIQYLREKHEVQPGSTVYTSGSGGLFKSGIPIGIIENVDLDKESMVNFFSDFSQLRYVKIASYSKEKFNIYGKAQEIERIKTEAMKAQKLNHQLSADKKIEVKARIEAERLVLIKEDEVEKLKKELQGVLNKQKKDTEMSKKEKNFDILEKKYSRKCKKNFFFTKLYKVGTPEYNKCILNKGIKN